MVCPRTTCTAATRRASLERWSVLQCGAVCYSVCCSVCYSVCCSVCRSVSTNYLHGSNTARLARKVVYNRYRDGGFKRSCSVRKPKGVCYTDLVSLVATAFCELCVAVCYRLLQSIAVCCSVLRCVVVCCSVNTCLRLHHTPPVHCCDSIL